MVKLKSSEPSEFEVIPEGEVVSARLENVEANTFDWDNPATGQKEKLNKLKWHFVVNEQGDWYGKTVQGSTSQSFTSHPNCKAYNWAVAISGKRYADGEEFDSDDILAMPCRIIIKHRDDNQGRTWMEVRDVLPAKAGAPTVAASPDESPF